MRQAGPDGYWVSDDRALIDVDLVHAWISEESYWAKGRPYQATVAAIENSLVFGLYAADGSQAGFARHVTDRATFAWLCDVFVAQAHRGHGLGSFLVQVATGHPDVAGLRQVLSTTPERTLYRQFGFDSLAAPERWMERRPSPRGFRGVVPPGPARRGFRGVVPPGQHSGT
jgi:GNAT superfamily N-acetyltransferase